MSTTKPKLTFDDLYTKQTEALYNLVMSSDQKWRQKWADDGFSQRNADTDKGYSNMNQTLLFKRAVEENLDDPRWLTFAQAKEHGYQIRKGAKSSEIFRLLDQTYERKVKDENGNVLKDENGKDITETVKYNQRLIVKHNVFNARDIDGIEPFKRAEIPEEHKQLLKQENYKNAEIMINAFCQANNITLQEMASEEAFYRENNGVTNGKVVLPLKAQFDNLDDYFSIAFHEVAHSTKALDIRINKETDTPIGNKFGSKNYAKEELTAELSALFLCRQFGINSTNVAERENNSLAYLKSWINQGVLDKDDFFVAVKEANRATRAIAEYAPQMTLTLEDLTQKQTESLSQSNLSISDRYGLDDDYIKNINNYINKLLDNKENINISFSQEILKLKENLTEKEVEALNSIKDNNLNSFNELSVKANNYLAQWETLKTLMKPSEIDNPSNIEKVAWIISVTENKMELKAVVAQILEDNHNQGKINQEQYDTLYNTYFDKINHYEKFKEVEKIRDDLYQLWQKWENREDFAQFLKLTEFERQPNIDPLTQEKAYFTSLIEEFKQTGDWQKLTGDNKNNLSMEEQIKNDLNLNEIGLSVKFQNERYTGEEAYLLLEKFRNEQPFKPETDHREMISIELKNTDVHSVSLCSIIAVKEHLQNNPESIFNGLKSLNEAFDRNAVDVSRKLSEYAEKELNGDLIFSQPREVIKQGAIQKKDTFTEQIESIFTQGKIEARPLIKAIETEKSEITSSILNGNYQEYIDNGYLALTKENDIKGLKVYELTEKGKNTINEIFDKVIAQENEKHGAKVTKKEVETLIDKLYNSHSNHAGGTEDEFRQSSFPESIIPKLDEAEKLLERPFNKHSLPYKEQLNNVMKLSNEYIEKWDNLQKGCFAFETGEVISQVKVLWTEANGGILDKKLGHNLNDVQNFIKDTYLNAEWRDDKNYNPLHPEKEYGYDKWQLELTYQTKNEQGETIYEKEKVRIDVGKGNADFNPLTMEFKDYLSQLTKTPIIEQPPKLSAEIRQELKQQQAEALQVKQQSKGMTM